MIPVMLRICSNYFSKKFSANKKLNISPTTGKIERLAGSRVAGEIEGIVICAVISLYETIEKKSTALGDNLALHRLSSAYLDPKKSVKACCSPFVLSQSKHERITTHPHWVSLPNPAHPSTYSGRTGFGRLN